MSDKLIVKWRDSAKYLRETSIAANATGPFNFQAQIYEQCAKELEASIAMKATASEPAAPARGGVPRQPLGDLLTEWQRQADVFDDTSAGLCAKQLRKVMERAAKEQADGQV